MNLINKSIIKMFFVTNLICMVLSGCGNQESVLMPIEEQTAQSELYTEVVQSEMEQSEQISHQTEPQKIFVYVCGAVNNPGVYEVEYEKRLYEVIQLAGGLQSDAASESVNQARLLIDGEQIYIPTRKEVAEGNTIPKQDAISDTNSTIFPMTKDKDNGMININTATLVELTSLSGIGENKAKAIIAYREEQGTFKAITDIMKVDGIGEGVYQKIKEFISVQ